MGRGGGGIYFSDDVCLDAAGLQTIWRSSSRQHFNYAPLGFNSPQNGRGVEVIVAVRVTERFGVGGG